MCSVWLSEETVPFALYVIYRLVFITEVESVYCGIGISPYNITRSFVVKGLMLFIKITAVYSDSNTKTY